MVNGEKVNGQWSMVNSVKPKLLNPNLKTKTKIIFV